VNRIDNEVLHCALNWGLYPKQPMREGTCRTTSKQRLVSHPRIGEVRPVLFAACEWTENVLLLYNLRHESGVRAGNAEKDQCYDDACKEKDHHDACKSKDTLNFTDSLLAMCAKWM
jgi:hypothetical protein